MVRTTFVKQSEIQKDWFIADASGQTLGRFASRIAQVLRGKHKPAFTPHMDMGDIVIVVNAEKIRVSGKKLTTKTYFTHSGYPGGGKFKDLRTLLKTHPERVVRQAVKGMLPQNRLGNAVLRHLKVYSGPDHPHEAQVPRELKI